ncbi:RyR domain-containing protein [Chloroflexota bacterium]
MSEKHRRKTVIVAGDATVDWNIAQVQSTDRPSYVWSLDNLTHAFCQRGGAALLADLVEAVAGVLDQSGHPLFEVRKMSALGSGVTPDDKRFHHTYALWKPFRMDERDVARGKKVWRVSEFLGIHRAVTGSTISSDYEKVANVSAESDLIILDDADLGFRDRPEYWPQALSGKTAKPLILLKIAPVLAAGNLWTSLKKAHPERVLALINANDLRRHPGVDISHQISWERTAQDLVWELLYNPQITGFTMFAHTVVSFGTSGAMLLSREKSGRLEATLFFDPAVMENEWNRSYPGGMVGYTSCLAAAIAGEMIANAAEPDFNRGIQSGVSAMRLLHKEGYGYASADLEQNPIAFPISKIASKIVEGVRCLATVTVGNPAEVLATRADSSVPEAAHLWTILETQSLGSLELIAKQIVREGLESALSGVPIGRYGKLLTVDRKEIEALNCIGGLIREYFQQPQKTPLSIAVFGPPGAGKSFAVKQVANWVQPGEFDTLTFNISQLSGPGDLLNAFHQVRDKALSGKIPLVFWDEFDTTLDGQPLGWLRYFLAPMQDGEFQEGQLIHPIGKSIFVFAGGTSHSMEAFAGNLGEEKYKSSKLPDFISRLRGFLNILGPNCQGNNTAEDPYYIIRRAILLRSILERNAPQLLRSNKGKVVLDIDEGVLRALLLAREYKHGARSMEGIILSSQLAGRTSFARSSLPTEAQLNLHVDGREFYSLVHIMEPDEDLLEKLAEAAHEVFCDHLRAEDYSYGPETREEEKIHSSLKPYRKLLENEKEQNRNNVRDIPNKLASIGYTMIPARGKETASELNDEEVALLARMEHERWMQEKLDVGWKYAKETDKHKRLHKSLVPWEKLPPEEQEKDYILVRGIPQILAKAGYTMVKLSDR